MSNHIIHTAYAEDHHATRIGVQTILSEHAHIHLHLLAENGKDMIRLLEKADPLPDVCIIDINMPLMNGFQLQSAIRERWPGIGTLVYTMYYHESNIIQMIKMGANGYLLKSAPNEELVRAIESVYRNGYYYSDVAGFKTFSSIQNNLLRLPHFSERELEFLKHCASPLSYQDIAAIMDTTPRALDGYRDRIAQKLNINNRIGLAMYAIQSGLVPVDISNLKLYDK